MKIIVINKQIWYYFVSKIGKTLQIALEWKVAEEFGKYLPEGRTPRRFLDKLNSNFQFYQ